MNITKATLFKQAVAQIKAKYISPGGPRGCADIPPPPAGHPGIVASSATTSDGFKLTLWRLPANSTAPPRPPVLLLHGLQCSGRDWFAGLDAEGLPYKLWRRGFDVWVGNNRGTFLSENPSWNWTFVEMADYDMPALVDAVLAGTGAQTLAFVGHSQGGLQALVHLAGNAQASAKVSKLGLLAPAVFMTQRRYTWSVLSGLHLDKIVEKTAVGGSGTSFSTYEKMFRDKCWVADRFCKSCEKDMGGSNMPGESGFAPTCFDKFRCVPAGTSSDNVRAFADGLRDGGFQAYMTGLGRPINLMALSIPTSLVAGEKDLFMTPANVERLKTDSKPGIVENFWVLPGGGHMDVLWGKDAPAKVFDPLINWFAS